MRAERGAHGSGDRRAAYAGGIEERATGRARRADHAIGARRGGALEPTTRRDRGSVGFLRGGVPLVDMPKSEIEDFGFDILGSGVG